jgi:HAMP domain-containing protein
MVGIVAPALGICYFYSISLSILPQNPEVFAEKRILLDTAAVIISVLIAINAGIVGFFVSRSISKPIGKLYEATRELEKGNFSVRTDIKTNDEIEQLSRARRATTAR